MNSVMADHVWSESSSHRPLWNEVNLLVNEENWRIRRLTESAHMLGYEDILIRPSIQIIRQCEQLIKKDK